MEVIYHCFGGAHTSITCAAIHLKYLPDDRIPIDKEFISIPYYDKMESSQVGKALYMGTDEMGCDIYVMGMKGGKRIVIPSVKSYLNSCHICHQNILFVNALAKLHPFTCIGGMTSRRLGLVSIGRALTIKGIIMTYPSFVELVKKVKENLRKRKDFS